MGGDRVLRVVVPGLGGRLGSCYRGVDTGHEIVKRHFERSPGLEEAPPWTRKAKSWTWFVQSDVVALGNWGPGVVVPGCKAV